MMSDTNIRNHYILRHPLLTFRKKCRVKNCIKAKEVRGVELTTKPQAMYWYTIRDLLQCAINQIDRGNIVNIRIGT